MPLAPYKPEMPIMAVYRDKRTGDLWEVIGYIDSPAAILQNVKTGERVTEIIGCPNAERWEAERWVELVEKP